MFTLKSILWKLPPYTNYFCLVKNVSKSSNLLHVQQLINASRRKTYSNLIYENNATSSGLSIINMIMNWERLANLSNISSDIVRYIYSIIT